MKKIAFILRNKVALKIAIVTWSYRLQLPQWFRDWLIERFYGRKVAAVLNIARELRKK